VVLLKTLSRKPASIQMLTALQKQRESKLPNLGMKQFQVLHKLSLSPQRKPKPEWKRPKFLKGCLEALESPRSNSSSQYVFRKRTKTFTVIVNLVLSQHYALFHD
jgi:hypothetical protein